MNEEEFDVVSFDEAVALGTIQIRTIKELREEIKRLQKENRRLESEIQVYGNFAGNEVIKLTDDNFKPIPITDLHFRILGEFKDELDPYNLIDRRMLLRMKHKKAYWAAAAVYNPNMTLTRRKVILEDLITRFFNDPEGPFSLC